jgi:hypothetical protein
MGWIDGLYPLFLLFFLGGMGCNDETLFIDVSLERQGFRSMEDIRDIGNEQAHHGMEQNWIGFRYPRGFYMDICLASYIGIADKFLQRL